MRSAQKTGQVPIRATWMVILLVGVGCADPPRGSDGPLVGEGAALRSPQAVAASERWILVANTGFVFRDGAPAWEQGSITFVDRVRGQVVGQVPTTQKNPQGLVVVGQRAYVVNGGELETGEDGVYRVGSPGGLDIIDLSAGVPTEVAANVALPRGADPRIGSFNSIVVMGEGRDQRAYLGSGTRGDLFVVDLATRTVLRGPDDPVALFATAEGENGMALLRPWGKTGLAALDFNQDQLCLIRQPATLSNDRDCFAVGVNRELLEGPIDLAFDAEGAALVLMTLANAVYRVEHDKRDSPKIDPPKIDPRFAATGLGANRLRVHGGQAYLVNAMSNNLQRVDLATGTSALPFAVLPVGSNPVDLVITEELAGPRAWVTLAGSHALALIDLDSGALLDQIGRASGAVAPDAAGGSDDAGVSDGAPDRWADGASDGVSDGGASEKPACDLGTELVGIDRVVEARYGGGAGYGQSELPEVIRGAPQGGGDLVGTSQGVLSLGAEGELIVDFGAYDIVDGPGPDFVVFENPFLAGGSHAPNAEPAWVGVSAAGTADGDFVEFPCDLTRAEGDPDQGLWPFPGCAGVRPVRADPRKNCLDPRDPAAGGGDAFDLAEIGVTRARYLRLRDAGVSLGGTESKGFDLDAVILIHAVVR